MENTADVVQVGLEIKPRVISVDVAANKVGLTLRSEESANRRNFRRESGDDEGSSNGAPARQQKFDGQRRMSTQGGARQGLPSCSTLAILPAFNCSFCS